jgi:hypothetical protein
MYAVRLADFGWLIPGETSMKSSRPWFALAFVLSTVLAVWLGQSRGGGGAGGLPGARSVVDAAKYPSLQAALDALPPEGGVVRIPPGTFEIGEPLVLSRGDVLLEGSGGATHIKNTNTQGKPALILKHPDGEKVKSKERLWRIQLANLRITGNKQSGHGIEAIQIEEVFLNGVSVSYHGGDGVRLNKCYEDPRITGCLAQPARLPRHCRLSLPVRREPGRASLRG